MHPTQINVLKTKDQKAQLFSYLIIYDQEANLNDVKSIEEIENIKVEWKSYFKKG